MSTKKNKHPLLKAAGLALGCMAVYNTLEYKKATSGNSNHREDCRVYTGRFGDIYYKHYGSGSPVILIHALEPSANMSEWLSAADKLSQSHSVYVIDLPGCGFSDKNIVDYSIYMYALAVNDFVKTRICRRHDTSSGIYAAASSTSAAILTCAALINPQLYSSLAFINPAAMENTYCNMSTRPAFAKALRAVYSTPVIGTFMYNLEYNKNAILRKLSNIPGLDDDERSRLADSMYEAAHTGGYYGRFLLASMHGNLLNSDIRRMLKKLSTPVLIVTGTANKQAKKALAAFDIEKDNISSVLFEDISAPQFECPDELAITLDKFFFFFLLRSALEDILTIISKIIKLYSGSLDGSPAFLGYFLEVAAVFFITTNVLSISVSGSVSL